MNVANLLPQVTRERLGALTVTRETSDLVDFKGVDRDGRAFTGRAVDAGGWSVDWSYDADQDDESW